MSAFQRIKKELAEAAPGPYAPEFDMINDSLLVTGIVDKNGRKVVDKQHGLVYGAGGDIDNKLTANACLLKNAPLNIEILVRALMRAAGNDKDLVEFLCDHAQKEILQECGQIEKESILKVIPT
jgi:hypothetical protein